MMPVTIPAPYGGGVGSPVMDDAVWERFQREHPEVPWHKPIVVWPMSYLTSIGADPDNYPGLGCRICIGRYGIKGSNILGLPKTLQEHDRHMTEVHGVFVSPKGGINAVRGLLQATGEET